MAALSDGAVVWVIRVRVRFFETVAGIMDFFAKTWRRLADRGTDFFYGLAELICEAAFLLVYVLIVHGGLLFLLLN